jgi:2'-5' RNA ligase
MSLRVDQLHAACVDASVRLARGDAGSVWTSSATGQPVGEQQVRYSSQPTISADVADSLVLHDWRARREILQPAGDLVREGLDLEGLPEWVDTAAVQSWLEGEGIDGEACGLLPALGELWAEGETYGGAILVAVADDGVPASMPVQLKSLRDVTSWEVLDRWSVWPYRSKGIGGPVDYWTVIDWAGKTGSISGTSSIIHPSRVAVHWGSWMPRRWRRWHDGWGCSRLELLRDQRDSLAVGFANLGRLLAKASTDVLTVAELSEMIAAAGAPVVRGKMSEVMQAVDSLGYAILDGGIEGAPQQGQPGRGPDKFESVARNLRGADDVTDQQHQDWRRGTGMPELIADGQLAGGLNSGEGAGQWRVWGGQMSFEQRRSLTRKAIWGLNLGFASSEGPTGGKDPGPYTVKWRPIAEPDREYEANVSKVETETDEIAVRMGTVTTKETRQHRNVDGKHGPVKVESAEFLPESSDDEIAAAGLEGAGAESVQALVLNGAQMAALLEITASVTAGSLPAEVAQWLIALSVPGLPTGPAASALAVAEAWGRANPELQAAPNAQGLDAASAMVRVFDVDTSRFDLVRLDAETMVGTWARALMDYQNPNAGVFVRVPDRLAVQFPYKPTDSSPPHVTVLHIGPTAWDQVGEIRECTAQLAQDLALLPGRARFGALGYFDGPKRVAWVAVEFEPDLTEFHAGLRARLMAEGVMVNHREGPWVAHATLASLEPGESYTGAVPVGEWAVERLEVWHGEDRG